MEVEATYGDEVRFVGIPGLSAAPRMQRFLNETGAGTFAHIPDEDGDLWARFEITQQRTYVYIDDDGSWRTADYGSLREDVEALIES